MDIRQSGIAGTANIADGAITNAKVNAAAAIDYSKLNLAASVTLADLATALANRVNGLAIIFGD